jgi:hypothetical protein
MRRVVVVLGVVLGVILAVGQARGQYVSVGAGFVLPPDLSAPPIGSSLSSVTANFSKSGMVTLDAGVPVLPFLTTGVHYSFARSELNMTLGDIVNSSARLQLNENTLAVEARLHTPRLLKWRAYGLAGVGMTRYSPTIESKTANAFPTGATSVTAPVFTVGGGVERRLKSLLGAKAELRDYISGISSQFYQPGGTMQRVAVTVGLVIGK